MYFIYPGYVRQFKLMIARGMCSWEESLQEMLIGIFIGVYSLICYRDTDGTGREVSEVYHNDTETSISGLTMPPLRR